ncbi:MAG: alpha-galactosidase [Bacteroidetes bacterium]|nr:MAG: alpha-galactosidase [Bacteroidota bacterium]
MIKKKNPFLAISFVLVSLILTLGSCNERKVHQIESGKLILEIDGKLNTRILSETKPSTPLNSVFQNSEYIVFRGKALNDFLLSSTTEKAISDKLGNGVQYTFSGNYQEGSFAFEKLLTIKTYELFPGMLFFRVAYKNSSSQSLEVNQWTNNRYCINQLDKDSTFWSFQGSSSDARADWILPVSEGFYQKNYMGMNNSDYGGGIPVLDIWRSDEGIAIGHTSLHPELVSMPVDMKYKKDKVAVGIEKNLGDDFSLAPGESLETLETFVILHNGDCFNSLRRFGDLMRAKGMQFAETEDAAFEAVWCAWGYERGFTLDEIIGTLPKVKELGFKWAVLDDGFQIAEGDWDVNKDKFPGGDQQMKNLVDKIHSYGLKAKLWWAPLAVDPCTNLLEESPDIILFNADWSPRFITWWDAYYMAPTYSKTIEHTKDVLSLFMDEWGFDGLKMDGQHMNAVPPDHHPDHGLDYPEQAAEQLPEFYKMVYENVREKKAHAVIENCPCGCCMSFYNMPFMNQAVSSDPLSSWQIRLKGKVYKALIPKTAYYGDHVELSDNGDDFASSFGIGAVLGSKFTWPKDNPTAGASYLLTPEKEVVWKKWIGLYNKKMLSKAEYLGHLYDIGFDKPEAYAIQKGDTLFYAFYADEWNGTIDLRGLDTSKEYTINNYFEDKNLGSIAGNNPVLETSFSGFLLIEVFPTVD